MTVKVIKIAYNKSDRSSTKYLMTHGDWSPESKGDLAAYDVTKEMEKAIREDSRGHGEEYPGGALAEQHARETGPRFGWAVYSLLEAGRAHKEVDERWKAAGGDPEHRPRVGWTGDGIWRIFKTDLTEVKREWT